ncbi:hypothetical protein D3C72_2473990 [compost metagenome]
MRYPLIPELPPDQSQHLGELREDQHSLACTAAVFNDLQQLLKFGRASVIPFDEQGRMAAELAKPG